MEAKEVAFLSYFHADLFFCNVMTELQSKVDLIAILEPRSEHLIEIFSDLKKLFEQQCWFW